MDEIQVIEAGSPEHLATFTVVQLRVLALSRRPEHIVAGYAALLELVRRGEDLPETTACPLAPCREPHDPEMRHYAPDCPYTHSHTGHWCGHGCGSPGERASQEQQS
jgi:hypothetical protein